jgi:hypothetical protein
MVLEVHSVDSICLVDFGQATGEGNGKTMSLILEGAARVN